MVQTMRAILLASAMAATFVGRRGQQSGEPGPMPGSVDLGVTDDGERSRHEQAAQIAVTLLADAASIAASSSFKSFEPGLHYWQYRNAIKGALSLRFAHMPLIELMITGTLNHRVPGSSPGAPTTQW
jgi:hypothetical protein